MQEPERNIVHACLKGDTVAQKTLYENHKVTMFRICLRYAKDRSEAQDMLQDGFIKVFNDLHQFKFQGPLGGWIRKVIVNTALQHIRKKKNLFVNTQIDELANHYQTDENVHSDIHAKALTKMIQQLPVGYRTVFNMYVIEGYSHKEIAEKMNITESTSKSQLYKAKAQLRGILEKTMIN